MNFSARNVWLKYLELGPVAFVKATYNYLTNLLIGGFVTTYNRKVRLVLPRKGEYPLATGKVKMGSIYEKRVFDDIVPWRTPFDNPRWGSWEMYEPELIDAPESCVREGDDVVIVGAGRGVTSVVSANLTGDNGQVISFEAQPMRVKGARSTVHVNGISDRVDIRQAVIGEAVHIPDMDYLHDLDTVPVDALPECDVLELDCEGAEIRILEELEIRPEKLIVETHGCYGAPSSEVISLLSLIGYSITAKNPQDEDRDIIILTAEL